MTEPWTFSGEVARVGQASGAVTLVEGSSFALSDGRGDIGTSAAQGLFAMDTRLLSRLHLLVDGEPLEALGVSVEEPYAATFLCRVGARPGHADSGLVVFRRRWIGRGMREEIEIRNYEPEARSFRVSLAIACDFADLFAVKEGRVRLRGEYVNEIEPGFLRFAHRLDGRRREVVVDFSVAGDVDGSHVAWDVEVGPDESWSVDVTVVATVDDVQIEPRFRVGEPVHASKPARRLAEWRDRAPVVSSDNPALDAAVARSIEDLGALRIFDPQHPERPVVAAGAPWFMTLFGRDSLLTSWMALPVDPALARGVVETLARFQGEKVDPATEEEPGRILHEVRFGESASAHFGGATLNFGSVDATPLFVMMLGELRRWGLDDPAVAALLPHADRALDWIRDFGDRDGDGYVEYQRATDHGLANQGWKDSWDGIRYHDGRVANAPVALCEVQGYVYAAFIARAHFAAEQGDHATYGRYARLAADLKERFNRDFWLEEKGWFAVGLDADKRPIDALASNMGHCLWTGIVDEDKAAAMGRHFVSSELHSGWGVRTLATSCAGYNPVSYHCGSVWPHDNAIVAAGLIRYGLVDEAHRIIDGMLDVAQSLGGRLPELFAGVSRGELAVPAAYPTSCVPQAWAAAAPLFFVRMMLRLDPSLTHDKVWMAPVLPPSVSWLRVERIPLGDTTISVEVFDDEVVVEGLPAHLELIREPRQPLTAPLAE